MINDGKKITLKYNNSQQRDMWMNAILSQKQILNVICNKMNN